MGQEQETQPAPLLATVNERWPASPICATSRANGEDVNHLFLRPPVEENAPLSDAEPPETLGTTEALDVAFRE
jgi:hypothetical protein